MRHRESVIWPWAMPRQARSVKLRPSLRLILVAVMVVTVLAPSYSHTRDSIRVERIGAVARSSSELRTHSLGGTALHSSRRTLVQTQGSISISEYPILSPKSELDSITVGPDGNIWYAELDGGKVGRISPGGSMTEFATGIDPYFITAGPDGNLWFTGYRTNTIGRISTSGKVATYPLPHANTYPAGIVAGPDGNLWFTEFNLSKIGRITPSGSVSEFSLPHGDSYPQGITRGPDGNLWFTESYAHNQIKGDAIGRITTAGKITEFPLASGSYPTDIVTGPDGNLWFSEFSADKIGRITPAGIISTFALPTPSSGPQGIAQGSGGNLWFTEYNTGKIGEITTKGVVLGEYTLAAPDSKPVAIVRGPAGRMWVAEPGANKIGVIEPHSTATGLVSWWKADGDAKDAIGPNDGTLSNVTFTSGVSGQAFSFNGHDSSVDFGPHAGNFGTGDFTIQFWIRMRDEPEQASGSVPCTPGPPGDHGSSCPRGVGVLGKRPICDRSSFWDIRGTGAGLSLELNGYMPYASTTHHLDDGRYHLVTFTRQGRRLRAYTDTSLDSTTTMHDAVDVSNDADLIAGRSTCTGPEPQGDYTGWLNGQLDEIKLYDRALSAADIAKMAGSHPQDSGTDLSTVKLVTYRNPSSGKHWSTTLAVTRDFVYQTTVGYLLKKNGPGRHALYDCVITSYNDHYVGGRDCDPRFSGRGRLMGYAFDTAPSGVSSVPLYRCYNGGSGGSDDHFDTTDSSCNATPGYSSEGIQGYILPAGPLECDHSEGNLICNPGFETGNLSEWSCTGHVTVDANNAHSGRYAVAIAASVNTPGRCSQIVRVQPFTEYTFTGHVKSNHGLDARMYVAEGINSATSSPIYVTQNGVLFTGDRSSVTLMIGAWGGKTGTAYFDDLYFGTCLVAWSCMDIGGAQPPGGQGYDGLRWDVSGGGRGMDGFHDQFHLTYRTLKGDGSLSANLVDHLLHNRGASAGIMIRQDTDAGSPFYYLYWAPDLGVGIVYRTVAGSHSKIVHLLSTADALDTGLMIVRRGNQFSAVSGAPNRVWRLLKGSTVTLEMPTSVLAGFAATAHTTDRRSLDYALFDHVSISSCSNVDECIARIGPLS